MIVSEDEIAPAPINRRTEIRLHDKQEKLAELPDTIFEALYGGALGGGKTFALVALPIIRKFHEHFAFKGIIFRRTFAELEKYVIPLAREIYEPAGGKYNAGKYYFKFPSGAQIFLSHMEQERDVESHDTNEYNYIAIDQAEKFTKFQLQYITSRVRRSRKDLPIIIRMSANPGGVSHTYLLDKFIRPAPAGFTILNDPLSKTKRIFIPANLQDNPSMMEADPGYYDRLNLLPEAERKAKMTGDWFALQGMVFTELRVKKFEGEPDNALHVIPPFPIPEWWPKILAIDWGYTAHTCALWGAISPDDRLFVYREYYQNKTSIANWASDVARLTQFDGNLKKVFMDPSAWQNRGDELTIAEQFRKWAKLIPHRADNDRIGGKLLIHDYLRFLPKANRYIPADGFDIEKANRILRLHGSKAYEDYHRLFLPEPPETNLPKVQFFPSIVNTLEALSVAQYDDKRKEDVAEFDGDDPYDAFRYLLKGSDHYQKEVSEENKRRRKFGDLQKKLEDGIIDQTSYHMMMDKVESETKKVFSVRLH